MRALLLKEEEALVFERKVLNENKGGGRTEFLSVDEEADVFPEILYSGCNKIGSLLVS